jgi:hypothetical protein
MVGRISAAYRALTIGGAPLDGAVATAWGLPPVLLAAGLFSLLVASLLPQIN